MLPAMKENTMDCLMARSSNESLRAKLSSVKPRLAERCALQAFYASIRNYHANALWFIINIMKTVFCGNFACRSIAWTQGFSPALV